MPGLYQETDILVQNGYQFQEQSSAKTGRNQLQIQPAGCWKWLKEGGQCPQLSPLCTFAEQQTKGMYKREGNFLPKEVGSYRDYNGRKSLVQRRVVCCVSSFVAALSIGDVLDPEHAEMLVAKEAIKLSIHLGMLYRSFNLRVGRTMICCSCTITTTWWILKPPNFVIPFLLAHSSAGSC